MAFKRKDHCLRSALSMDDDGPDARNSGGLPFEAKSEGGRSGVPKYGVYERPVGWFNLLLGVHRRMGPEAHGNRRTVVDPRVEISPLHT